MSKRLKKPDTEADIQLRQCLEAKQPVSFIMISGAGSGKTTSLVKALDYLNKTRGSIFKRRGQKIACITYTEVAEREILDDIGLDSIFHVSTIHSFLWAVIRPFQNDIRGWIIKRLNEKISDAQEKIEKPLTRPKTIEAAKQDIERYQIQLGKIPNVPRFIYGTGSNYEKGVLGHDDILKMVPNLIIDNDLLKTIISDRFPFVFVDESQDTTETVVKALKSIDAYASHKFCLGFFGDPMQKIYTTGIGKILEEENWITIKKPENFRCSKAVLPVINKIRYEDDKLEQIHGHEGIALGSAIMFILPRDEFRTERLENVRATMAKKNNDPLWSQDNGKDVNIRVLVIIHKMAALRLGFGDLYAAFNADQPPSFLKDGFIDGSSWAITPFLSYILPLVQFAQDENYFDVISFLRRNSPVLAKDSLSQMNTSVTLQALKDAVAQLVEMLSNNECTVAEAFRLVRDSKIILLDGRINQYLLSFDNGTLLEGVEEETLVGAKAMSSFFSCPVIQLWAYQRYIQDQSPFSTQQGVKGSEFTRVLTILDDEEGAYTLFSYDKYFNIVPLSQNDNKNISEGNESVIDRTRRLFYVCCSRAVQDLAVVLFASDTNTARQKVIDSGIFPEEHIHLLDDIVIDR